jgi:anaerobic glycerol-3-phosphate dehydrogenase
MTDEAKGVKLTAEQFHALEAFRSHLWNHPYAIFEEGPMRDELRRAGLIERWNPVLKHTGKRKPWRLTPAGRQALSQEGEGR